MAKITTVRGDISPSDLGLTSMHSHTLIDFSLVTEPLRSMMDSLPPERMTFKPENFAFFRSGVYLFSDEYPIYDDVDFLTAELNAFKKVGGNSICDASPIGLRINPMGMKKASEASGVNIICATGIYTALSRPAEFMGKTEEYILSRFEKEINGGINGTDIKPGFLKCAINTPNNDNIDESELTSVRACAKIAAENGMSLHVHSAYPLTDDHILKAADIVLNECGVKPERLLMMHMDAFLTSPVSIMEYVADINATRKINTDLQARLLDKGINIGFDTWGAPMDNAMYQLPNDYERLKGLVDLLKKGYASQIVLGNDTVGKYCGVACGNYGYTRELEFVPSMLTQLGFGQDVIDKLLVENPARILAY